MGSSGSMRAQIGTLIIATSGVQLANGFFNTLISLRVAIESFEATMAGLVLSSYLPASRWPRCAADRSSSRLGTSAPTPPSLGAHGRW
jgi:hypothetical protein